jgi:DNA-damage-inducible protein D
MKHELIHSMTESFEGHAQETENGVEYWLARDLQHLLSYTKWDNFLNLISKAKTACEFSGHEVGNHFVDGNKMVDPILPSSPRSEHPSLEHGAIYRD